MQLCGFLGLEPDILKSLIIPMLMDQRARGPAFPPPLLLKDPKVGVFKPGDVLTVNYPFVFAGKKVPIGSKDIEPQHKKKDTEDNRPFIVQAVLVRIMKSRKAMKWAELQAEAVRQIQMFKPEPRMLKSVLQKLVEDGYIERDPGDPNSLTYLA